jgi:hypothetical protein
MRPSNDLNSPAVLGQPIALTQKRTYVWDGSIFQDDRACAATDPRWFVGARISWVKLVSGRPERLLAACMLEKPDNGLP